MLFLLASLYFSRFVSGNTCEGDAAGFEWEVDEIKFKYRVEGDTATMELSALESDGWFAVGYGKEMIGTSFIWTKKDEKFSEWSLNGISTKNVKFVKDLTVLSNESDGKRRTVKFTRKAEGEDMPNPCAGNGQFFQWARKKGGNWKSTHGSRTRGAQPIDVKTILPGMDCKGEATYNVKFEGLWTSQRQPVEYPSSAHWSWLVGGSHSRDYSMWTVGGISTAGVKSVAETGSTSQMKKELKDADGVFDYGQSPKLISDGVGSMEMELDVNAEKSLISVITMIAPSPDWIAGVDSIDMCDRDTGKWKQTFSLSTLPMDAGTDSGAKFTSANDPTDPKEPISEIKCGGGVFCEGEGAVTPVGEVTFEYASLPSCGDAKRMASLEHSDRDFRVNMIVENEIATILMYGPLNDGSISFGIGTLQNSLYYEFDGGDVINQYKVVDGVRSDPEEVRIVSNLRKNEDGKMMREVVFHRIPTMGSPWPCDGTANIVYGLESFGNDLESATDVSIEDFVYDFGDPPSYAEFKSYCGSLYSSSTCKARCGGKWKKSRKGGASKCTPKSAKGSKCKKIKAEGMCSAIGCNEQQNAGVFKKCGGKNKFGK